MKEFFAKNREFRYLALMPLLFLVLVVFVAYKDISSKPSCGIVAEKIHVPAVELYGGYGRYCQAESFRIRLKGERHSFYVSADEYDSLKEGDSVKSISVYKWFE